MLAYLTVRRDKDHHIYHVPFLNVVKIIENSEGVTVEVFCSIGTRTLSSSRSVT